MIFLEPLVFTSQTRSFWDTSYRHSTTVFWFLYGMSIADNFIKSGQYKNILLVGAELHSKGLNRTPAGRDVAVLFGDGAGAAVISATEVSDSKTDSHILASQLHSDGHFAKGAMDARSRYRLSVQRPNGPSNV